MSYGNQNKFAFVLAEFGPGASENMLLALEYAAEILKSDGLELESPERAVGAGCEEACYTITVHSTASATRLQREGKLDLLPAFEVVDDTSFPLGEIVFFRPATYPNQQWGKFLTTEEHGWARTR